jgi:PAS domain S-box-containing protein
MAVAGHHDLPLVVLSVVIAIFASYAALDLAGRIRVASGWVRRAWLGAAALAMGGGIWSMHFVAMLAFSMPMALGYDLATTLVSLALPVAVTAIAFLVTSRGAVRPGLIAISGTFLGLGIVTMHYTGMAAMQMPARLSYDPLLVAASVVIAIGASVVALWLAFTHQNIAQKMASAVAMGLAIAGMHYTAMAAAIFTAEPGMQHGPGMAALEQTSLALGITVITLLILGLGLVASIFDRRFAILAEREALALRESEERFRSLYERAPVPLHSLDMNGLITRANSQWLELLGYSFAEVAGRHICEFQTADSARAMREIHWPAFMARRELADAELQFVKKSGQVIDVRLSSRTVPSQRDGSFETYSVIVDVTAQRIAEAAFRQAQKIEAVGRLTGGVAHDFNNLLTVISGNLGLLEVTTRAAGTLRDRMHRLIDTAQRAADRGARLTQQLLAFSRQQSLHPERFGVNAAITGCATLLERAAGETIVLELALSAEERVCDLDPAQLEAAILNLVINARDAMPKGGALTVATEALSLDATRSAPLGVKPGDFMQITVRDTGSGMTREVLNHLFEPFYTTKEIGKGSGLGLAQVYGFVTQSGGHIGVESEVGRGSAFTLLLPCLAGTISPPQHDRAEPAPTGHETILVVEDDADVCATAVATLADLGYSTLTASHGPAALAIVESGQPIDLIFSDIVMPGGMTGAELARRARRLRPDTRILLTSGYSDDATSSEFRLLRKPYQRRQLAEAIREALEAPDGTGRGPIGAALLSDD